jgi:hypothetical protein
MRYGISGGRADGTDWPLAGDLLECDDAEAEGLVAGQLADWADPEPAAGESAPPAARANREAWEAHAVTLGLPAEAAAAMTKAQLMERFSAGA